MNKNPQQHKKGGAYVLHLNINKSLTLQVGALGEILLPSGHYVYVGSAQKSISGRVSRHRTLAETKAGKFHWHIDYALAHPEIKLVGIDELIGCRECDIAGQIASMPDASVPVARFGSSDCRSGCKAHLFRIANHKNFKLKRERT